MLDDTLAQFDNSFELFKTSHIFQNSSCMCLLQIGELCKYLSEDFRKENDTIDWKGWCGLRDIFAHQYGKLNIEENWLTIVNDYPILRNYIKELLKKD